MRLFSVTHVIDEELARELRKNLGRDLQVEVHDYSIVIKHPQGQPIVFSASPAMNMLKARGGDVILLQASLNVAIGDANYPEE